MARVLASSHLRWLFRLSAAITTRSGKADIPNLILYLEVYKKVTSKIDVPYRSIEFISFDFRISLVYKNLDHFEAPFLSAADHP